MDMKVNGVWAALVAATLMFGVAGCGSVPRPQPSPPEPPFVCPTEDMPQLPWPVPKLTIKQPIPLSKLFGGTVPNLIRLSDVEARLTAALDKAGYGSFSYLGVGCDGFALMPEFEQIEANGKRKATVQRSSLDVAGYIESLFAAPYGYYRQIIFVVTDDVLQTSSTAPLESELRDIGDTGVSALPYDFTYFEYNPARHRIYALVYEFEKDEGDTKARLKAPNGRLSLDQHLVGAGLFKKP